MHEISGLKVVENIKVLGEISGTWQNTLLGIDVSKTLESCWWSLLRTLLLTLLLILQ